MSANCFMPADSPVTEPYFDFASAVSGPHAYVRLERGAKAAFVFTDPDVARALAAACTAAAEALEAMAAEGSGS